MKRVIALALMVAVVAMLAMSVAASAETKDGTGADGSYGGGEGVVRRSMRHSKFGKLPSPPGHKSFWRKFFGHGRILKGFVPPSGPSKGTSDVPYPPSVYHHH